MRPFERKNASPDRLAHRRCQSDLDKFCKVSRLKRSFLSWSGYCGEACSLNASRMHLLRIIISNRIPPQSLLWGKSGRSAGSLPIKNSSSKCKQRWVKPGRAKLGELQSCNQTVESLGSSWIAYTENQIIFIDYNWLIINENRLLICNRRAAFYFLLSI